LAVNAKLNLSNDVSTWATGKRKASEKI